MTPAAEVARVAALMRLRVETPCGAGTMPWRIWDTDDKAPKPTLVLMHGGSGSWTHWLRNIEFFEQRYRVLVPDLPGLGDAAELSAPYTAQQAAAIVNDGLDVALRSGAAVPVASSSATDSERRDKPQVPRSEVAPARFHLAAFSWGCTIAGQIAALRGQQIRSLSLIGPAAIGPFPLGKMQPLKKRWRGITDAELRDVSRHNLQQLMLHDPAKIDDLAIHLQIENTNRTRFHSPQFARSEILVEALARTTVPLSVIYGEYDGPIHPHVEDRRQRLRKARPDLEFHMVPNVGHWAQFEWEGYNGYLQDWLARHD